MSNWVTYGQVVIRDVKLIEHRCQPVIGASNLNIISRKETYVFLGVIYPGWNQVGPLNAGQRDNRMLRTAADSMQNIKEELSKPRLSFKYYIGNTVAVQAPEPTEFVDPGGGPFPVAVQMVEVNAAGAIVIRFGVEFSVVDATAPDGLNGANSPILEWCTQQTHDVDGDTLLTTISTTVMVQMNKQFLYNFERFDDVRQYVDLWLDRQNAPELTIPDGFKRGPIRTEVMADATQARIHFVDTEKVMPLGSLSPATKFEATYAVLHGLGGSNKEGALEGHGILNVNAVGPKTRSRWSLLRMALRLAVQKLSTRPNFIFFTRAQVVYVLHEIAISLQVECKFKPVDLRGPGGIHIDGDAGLTPVADFGDISDAFAPCRQAGEPSQGFGRLDARSPYPVNTIKGTWIGHILQNRIKGNSDDRVPISKADFCAPTVNLSNSQSQNRDFGAIVDTDPDDDLQLNIVTDFTIPLYNWGFDYFGNTWLWETAKMATRYFCHSGQYILPIAGALPGTTLDPAADQVKVVNLHGEYTTKEVQWQNSACGDSSPPYPSTNTRDTKDVLLSSSVIPHAPTPLSANVTGSTIQGTYVYGRKQSVKPGNPLPTGKLPTAPQTVAAYTIPGGKALDGYMPGG